MRNLFAASLCFALAVAFLPFSPGAKGQTPTEVGTIPGAFQVSLTGSASYSIPIQIPPGASKVEPKIALAYDSQSTGGVLGAGWSIAGLSVITRGPKDYFSDGHVDGVRFTDNDALYLDGARLVPIEIAGNGPSRRTEYRKQSDDQTQTIQIGDSLETSTFLVRTKGGITLLFDGSNGSRVRLNDGRMLLHAVSRILDSAGNSIQFEYENHGDGDYDIAFIRYTGRGRVDQNGVFSSERPGFAVVQFAYEQAPRTVEAYVAGYALSKKKRLTSIRTAVTDKLEVPIDRWTQFSRYIFDYADRQQTWNRYVLSSIHQFGEDDTELEPTAFTYSEPAVGWKDAPFSLPVGVAFATAEQLSGAYRFTHFTTDNSGLPDLLVSALIEGKVEAFAFQNSGGDWAPAPSGFKPPFAFTNTDGADLGAAFVDLNADGRTDLLQSYKPKEGDSQRSAYLAGEDKWDSAEAFHLPFDVSVDGKRTATLLFGRFAADRELDLLYEAEGKFGFLQNTGSEWKEDANLTPPTTLSIYSALIDFDCDAQLDLLTLSKSEAGVTAWRAFRFSPDGWREELREEFLPTTFIPTSIDPRSIIQVRFGTSACSGFVASSANGPVRVAIEASSAGWKHVAALTPPFDLVDAAGHAAEAVVADLDNDGRLDVMAHQTQQGVPTIRFAYRQSDQGWEVLPEAYFPPPLGSSDPGSTSLNPFVGDLDGDKYADIVLPGGIRGGLGRVWQGTSNGFEEVFDYGPKIPFARSDQQDRGIRILDLNGDGLPDIVFNRETEKTSGPIAKGAFINTGRGWLSSPGLTPLEPIASEHITGNPAQFIDVDGDGHIDMLYSVVRSDGVAKRAYFRNEPCKLDSSEDATKCGDVGQRDPRLHRKWVLQESSPGVPSSFAPPEGYPFTIAPNGDQGVRFVDLDGNGRTDILVGFLPPKGAAIANKDLENCETTNGVKKCEWNRSFFRVAAFLNDGTTWVRTKSFDPPVPFVSQGDNSRSRTQDLFVQLMDVNGDRLPDIVASFQHPYDTTRAIQEVWTNTGRDWKLDTSISLPKSADGSTFLLDQPLRDRRALVQANDINGDGLADIVFTKRDGSANGSVTFLSTGRGFKTSGSEWTISVDAIADREGDQAYRMIDINGDGFVDVVYSRESTGGEKEAGALINNGSGFVAVDKKLVEQVPTLIDKNGLDQGVRFFDVDGNGLLDTLQSFASGSSNTIPQQVVLLNSGRRADVLWQIEPGYDIKTTIHYQALLEANPDAIQDSMTAAAPWDAVYVPGIAPSYPIIAPVPATYVVRRTVVSESTVSRVGTSYRYGDYRVDAIAMRPLGFGWRESLVENDDSRLLTRIELLQDARMPGRLVREATCWVPSAVGSAKNGERAHWARLADPMWTDLCPATVPKGLAIVKLGETLNQWSLLEGAVGGGNGLSKATIRQVALDNTSTSKYELDGGLVSAEKTTYTYDTADILKRRLNVLCVEYVRGDGTSVTTTNEYNEDNEASWYFGRLTKSTVVKVGDLTEPGGNARYSETRVAAFGYDAGTGLLRYEVANADIPAKAVTTTYDRDEFGNVVVSTVTARGERPHVSSAQFDELGRFQTASINALGHVTILLPKRTTGAPLLVTSPNGTSTSYTYDGFGRLITEVAPTGLVSEIEIFKPEQLADQALLQGITAAYVVRKTVGDLPPTIQIFDNRARIIRTVADGFTPDGVTYRPVLSDIIYDALGRSTDTSLPYYLGSEVFWTHVKYDVLGRVLSATAPDGATKTNVYSSRSGGGLVVTSYDPLGRVSATQSNMRLLPILSTFQLGEYVSYEYDAADRVVEVRGAGEATTTFAYDAVGMRVESVDPDMGHWTYQYDAFGQLVQQIDAKRQVTTLEYDPLGRLIRKAQNDGTVVWTYDAAPHGIGLVTSVQGSDGYREEHFYDDVGREIRRAVTIGSETFSTGLAYDDFGRITKALYPTGIEANNRYDAKGFLIEVAGADKTNPYWKAVDVDIFGRVTKEVFGNATATTRIFDPKSGRPRSIEVQGSVTSILDLNLEYDLVGNLLERREANGLTPGKPIKEVFSYDVLDRITGTDYGSGTDESYKFDSAGRLAFKSTVGNYTYASGSNEEGTFKPFHAVVATELGGSPSSYTYDDNGNMIAGPMGELEYTSDNKVKLVYENKARWVRFDYAPDGSRYRQYMRSGLISTETLYLGSVDRITTFSGPLSDPSRGYVTRFRHYLANQNGVFAVIETSGDSSKLFDRNTFPDTNPLSELDAPLVWYLHKDQLGSVVKITDEAGVVAASFWYEPWGKRTSLVTDPKGVRDSKNIGHGWHRGFTGHEHMDQFSLIHMNGRVYNSLTSLFTSSDPAALPIGSAQMINKFAYAMGNPLKYVDPTGYWSWGGAIVGAVIGFATGGPGGAAVGFLVGGNDDTRRFVQDNWKTAVIIGATVAVTVATGGAGAGIGYAILAGMAGGATSGALTAYLYGGSFDDILAAAVQGAVIGGFSGAIGYGVASLGLQGVSGYAAQGVGSGVTTSMQGGNFGTGFAVGFATGAIASGASRYNVGQSPVWYKGMVGAVTGGVASKLSGGKFENGAVTGAFAAIMTHYARETMMTEGRPLTAGERKLAKDWFDKNEIDPNRVRIVDGTWNEYQNSSRPMAPNGNIYMGSVGCADFSAASCGSTATFMHELTHVAQYQSGTDVVLQGAYLQFRSEVLGHDVYSYQPGQDYRSLNIEQQGQFTEDMYRTFHGP